MSFGGKKIGNLTFWLTHVQNVRVGNLKYINFTEKVQHIKNFTTENIRYRYSQSFVLNGSVPNSCVLMPLEATNLIMVTPQQKQSVQRLAKTDIYLAMQDEFRLKRRTQPPSRVSIYVKYKTLYQIWCILQTRSPCRYFLCLVHLCLVSITEQISCITAPKWFLEKLCP
jgi:hypothetical protein